MAKDIYIGEGSPDRTKPGKPLKIAAIILACIVAIAIIAFSIMAVHFGGVREALWELEGGKLQYSYVLVHGLGGWGNDGEDDNRSPYWGSSCGDLAQYLRDEGYQVYTPSVGPISSTWDRVCELYAQLTGTTVDYGEAHSKAHNHDRFGRTYSEPLVPGLGEKTRFGQTVKVNLIGHSYGGETVRLLTSLLAYGDEDEKALGNENMSPLFAGGHSEYVNSVTTLCSPHNGSSLTNIGNIAGLKSPTELLASLCFATVGIAEVADVNYDFMLDQFGLVKEESSIQAVCNSLFAAKELDNDHAGYDISVDGAAKLNEKIKLVDSVYYFSYSYCTTKQGAVLNVQVPQTGTPAVFYPLALAMGAYSGTSAGGIEIGRDWRANDGLVNVVSAKYPLNDTHTDIPENTEEIAKGIWNVAPTLEGHHGTVIGTDGNADEIHDFYNNLFTLIDSLKRY